MDPFNLGDGDAMGLGEELDLDAPCSYTGILGQLPQTVTVTLADHQNQQNYIQSLHSILEKQHGAITELVAFNHNMHAAMHKLDARVAQLESDAESSRISAATTLGTGMQSTFEATANAALDADNQTPPMRVDNKAIAKVSAKRPLTSAFATDSVSTPGRMKCRKKLQVKIPSNATEKAPGVGLPTPMLSALPTAPTSALRSFFPATPRTPYTPGRIGPPDSYKKTATSINKRDIHNLNKFIPPANVQLPLVPLTDTEVIVYFFNSLSNPVVSLRLYARGWGPASIVQALNEHRAVEPPYLRNTCSVKCTTAIKNGKKLYGDHWETENRAVFADAEDAKATDLIRVDENDSVDYYVRALGANLKKHPSGQDAGIFTACVKYCMENYAPYTMTNVYQLAVDIQDGNVPQHPASPDPFDMALPPETTPRARKDDETREEQSQESDLGTPSPLAGRKPLFDKFGGPLNFTVGSARTE